MNKIKAFASRMREYWQSMKPSMLTREIIISALLFLCLLLLIGGNIALGVIVGILQLQAQKQDETPTQPGQQPTPYLWAQSQGFQLPTGDREQFYSYENFHRLYLASQLECLIEVIDDNSDTRTGQSTICMQDGRRATAEEIEGSTAYFAWKACNLSGYCQTWQQLLQEHPEWRWPDSQADKKYAASLTATAIAKEKK